MLDLSELKERRLDVVVVEEGRGYQDNSHNDTKGREGEEGWKLRGYEQKKKEIFNACSFQEPDYRDQTHKNLVEKRKKNV